MKHTHAAQLSGALRQVKLAGIETKDAYTIVKTIVACEQTVEEIQKMVKTAAEGLKDKPEANLQEEVNKVLAPFLDKEMKVETISQAAMERIMSQDGIKAEEAAVIYQHMVKE